jgi:hypothetical protein
MKLILISLVMTISASLSNNVELYKYDVEEINTCETGTFHTSKEYCINDTISFYEKTFVVLNKYQ